MSSQTTSVFSFPQIGGRDRSRLAETIMLPLGPPSLICSITCLLVTVIGQVLSSSKRKPGHAA